ncbi:MAG TPA: cytochrome c oxidase subunit II [Jiangellaceae bacterium]
MTEQPGRPNARRHLLVAGLSWVVLTVAGVIGVRVWAADSFPFLAAEQGAVADDAILFLFYLVIPVFMFVLVAVVYAMIRFRARPDDLTDSAVQVRTHRGYTMTWLGTTTALAVLVIIHPGVTGLMEIWDARDEPDPLVVEVTAQQWEWSFTYPEQGVENQPELVLPVDQPVRFVITSEDVIHSFWIPAFRLKQDAVPGATTELHITPDRIGDIGTSEMLRVQCAELCGIGHADMAAEVSIVTAAEFDEWVTEVGGGQ